MENERIAVIDTETTWANSLMSIGVVIADSKNFEIIDKKYYIILPNKNETGMYTNALYVNGVVPNKECTRRVALKEINDVLVENGITKIFAYNALFDYGQLPEFKSFDWYDIMRIAAYKQYNSKIPESAECYKTGKLKRSFGVESVYRMLSGNSRYNETHNGLLDAADELGIMHMLGVKIGEYVKLKK